MKSKFRWASALTAAACAVSCLGIPFSVTNAAEVTSYSTVGVASNNRSANDCSKSNWAETVKSYLMQNDDGTLTRVEYNSGNIICETFDDSGSVVSRANIDMELPVWGGFFAGETYNFFVFAQDNPNESDSVEVMRVVKYDKNWNRIGSREILGANTRTPIYEGTLRMAEDSGRLYIHTCHDMYAMEGSNYQSNLTFTIHEASMSLVDSQHKFVGGFGYVPQTFNQFVQGENGILYRIDQSDYRPRGVQLTVNTFDDYSRMEKASTECIFEFGGSYNSNYHYTGASLGGFELSDSSILLLGNSLDQSILPSDLTEAADEPGGYQRNIFLTVTNKADITLHQTLWITSYPNGCGVAVHTPQFVKVADDRFVILWEEENAYGDTVTKNVTVDGTGQMIGNIEETTFRLSDCQPIATKEHKVVWYVTENSAPTVYTLSPYLGDGYASDTTTETTTETTAETSATDTQLTTETTTETTETTQPPETPDYLPGDVDFSGAVNAADASRILAVAANAGLNTQIPLQEDAGREDTARLAADVNKDGQIDAKDASYVLVYTAKAGLGDVSWEDVLQ